MSWIIRTSRDAWRALPGQESSIHCDELVSLQKSLLTHYVGRLGESRMTELNRSLLIALDLE